MSDILKDCELTEIANKFMTDKGTKEGECHGYTEFYEPLFQRYKRDRHVSVLEVGVFNGASLKMYDEYFCGDCSIVGIDLESKKQYDTDNIRTVVANQGSRKDLEEFVNMCRQEGRTFDIIVDDGSHINAHQQLTLYYLSQLPSKDGIYIVEDLHTWVWEKDITKTTLYSLAFNKPFAHLKPEESAALHNRIADKTIWCNHSSKSMYTGDSITSVLRFK